MFDAPAGAQMSFFPSEAEQIQSIAEAESVTPSAFSMFISQNDIDHILRAGGNADATRMKIAAEFSKQKPLEDRAVFLKKLYYGGNGLRITAGFPHGTGTMVSILQPEIPLVIFALHK